MKMSGRNSSALIDLAMPPLLYRVKIEMQRRHRDRAETIILRTRAFSEILFEIS